MTKKCMYVKKYTQLKKTNANTIFFRTSSFDREETEFSSFLHIAIAVYAS